MASPFSPDLALPRTTLSTRISFVLPASVAFDSLASRLGRDLRTRFPEIEVRVRASDDGMVCEVSDGGDTWGAVSLLEDEADAFSHAEVESFVAAVVANVADNLWPDDLTDPWPLCPAHGDHPLQPGLVGGQAAWRCLHGGPAVPMGELRP
jgi:hypothetical protein